MGNSIPPNHEDHIARKGGNSLQHYNLVHKFIPENSRSEGKQRTKNGKIGGNFGVEPDESQKQEGGIVKHDSGSFAVFIKQGFSASKMTAAKIMDIISRLPGCDGQAADAVSAYTQVKMEDAHKLLKIPKSECPDNWIRLPRHKWPKSWSSRSS